MVYQIKLDQFSGPFDLLLRLIEEEKLDISRVSLGKVTDQYLDYLRQVKDFQTVELSDFIFIAAKLIYLKSNLLLPPLLSQEEEALTLENQLKLYREYVAATKIIKDLYQKKNIAWVRKKFFFNQPVFVAPRNISPVKIFEFFQFIVKNLEKQMMIVKKLKRKIISLAEKIQEIYQTVSQKKRINFSSFLTPRKTKIEIIISFLAVLELVKRSLIEIQQNKLFGEIIIKKENS